MTERSPYIPEPDTSHPYYADKAEGIRAYLHLPSLRVAETRMPGAASFTVADKPIFRAATNIRTLTVQRCAGPAPFVGDPIWEDGWYVWAVAADDLGRHVAGPATLEISRRATPRGRS